MQPILKLGDNQMGFTDTHYNYETVKNAIGSHQEKVIINLDDNDDDDNVEDDDSHEIVPKIKGDNKADPVVLETDNEVVSPPSLLQNYTDDRNKDVYKVYGIQPSFKSNDIITDKNHREQLITPPNSFQFEPIHSTVDDLNGIRKKRTRVIPPWKVKMSNEGDIYYHNPVTGEDRVTRPSV